MLARRCPRSIASIVALAAVVALAVPVGPATAQSLKERLQETEQVRDSMKEAVGQALDELEEVRGRIEHTRAEIGGLEKRARELEEEAASATEALEERARSTFIRGGDVPLESLLNAEGPTDAVERMEFISTLSRTDSAVRESAISSRVELEQTKVLLAARAKELDQLEVDAQRRGEELQARFAEIDVEYTELKERVERQREIARGPQTGTYSCIFGGAYHFIDSWGFPRSGGRSHKGTDVMAPFREPVYAFTTGTISRLNNNGLGGISLYIQGDDGHRYYYTHLDGYAEGVAEGMRVEAGDHIAYNGHTGNADASAPHVHFEIHPGGGEPVNPYPWLMEVC